MDNEKKKKGVATRSVHKIITKSKVRISLFKPYVVKRDPNL